MDGILNIYKPTGCTSHDIVAKVRRHLKTKKVGHTGTLDPMAEGVLPVCIGYATKVSQYMIEKDKEYIGELKLGVSTDTYDSTGAITSNRMVEAFEEDIISAVSKFIGEIEQYPPIFSALKVNGKKLYEYARSGKEVEIKSRRITIYDIKIISVELPFLKLKVNCSKGTYIRSLFHDIGETLGCGAHMTALVRTGSGTFTTENAVCLDDFLEMTPDEIEKILLPADFPVTFMKPVKIKTESLKYLINGTYLLDKNLEENIENFQDDEEVRLYFGDEFMGIGRISTDDGIKLIKPQCIFNKNP
ncbi:MAG: tRNA pseudouridine(55) synthase TruB [Eubacteriaceae bacterium]|nr:tRNA pseudouridine(55) synthase TruB [Eubacteriaceae bacterium]